MSARLITIRVSEKDSVVVSDNVPTGEAEITLFARFHEAGAARRVPLDLDALDIEGAPLYFPATTRDGVEHVDLRDLLAWLDETLADPDVQPDAWQWNSINDYAFRKQLQRTQSTEQPESIPLVTRQSDNATVVDVISVVDEDGNFVEFRADTQESPRLLVEGQEIVGFHQWSKFLMERYPAEDIVLPSGVTYPAPAYVYGNWHGDWEDYEGKVWYQERMPMESEKTPDKIVVKVLEPVRPPKPRHGHWQWKSREYMRRILADGTEQLAVAIYGDAPVEWDSGPLEGGDGPAVTPVVEFSDGLGMPPVVKGIHGTSEVPGFLQALVDADLPSEGTRVLIAKSVYPEGRSNVNR